jgi:hypothetical protein
VGSDSLKASSRVDMAWKTWVHTRRRAILLRRRRGRPLSVMRDDRWGEENSKSRVTSQRRARTRVGVLPTVHFLRARRPPARLQRNAVHLLSPGAGIAQSATLANIIHGLLEETAAPSRPPAVDRTLPSVRV